MRVPACAVYLNGVPRRCEMKHIPGFAAESSLGPAIGMYMVPQFSAEASPGPTRGVYGGKTVRLRTERAFAVMTGTIEPQQAFGVGPIIGGDCFGSVVKKSAWERVTYLREDA